MLLHDDEEEDDILCSVDVQRLDLPAVASSDFVVKTHDSNPILFSFSVGASGITSRENVLGAVRIGISIGSLVCVSSLCASHCNLRRRSIT